MMPNRDDKKAEKDELDLYKQALTKAVALPKGQLPHEKGKYYTCMLNGNVVVKKES